MGEFAKAVATLKLELRCPFCGEMRQIEKTRAGLFCATCSKSWAVSEPALSVAQARDAQLAKVFLVPVKRDPAEDDPDPDYGL